MIGALVIDSGQGHVWVLDDSGFVGSAGDADVRLNNDPYVSTRHAAFTPHDDSWWVEDLGSTNGIYLVTTHDTADLPGIPHYGGTRHAEHRTSLSVPLYGPHRLSRGDRLRIGHTVLTVIPT